MCRLSLLLIATIAVASFLAQSAAGQFPSLPKITLPKIFKKEAPPTPSSTPNDSEPVRRTSDSPSPVPNAEVRGKPIPGAKLIFSSNPDFSNPKTSFTSSEFIYGRLDLGGRTVYDAFGLKNQGADAKFYYINYSLEILKPGVQPWDNWSGEDATMVTKEEAQKTYWDFDVLPEPSRAYTRSSASATELQYYHNGAGIYTKWYNDDSARSTFPQNGTYTIDITLFGNSYDDWGKKTGEREKFPTVTATFAFQFSGTDGQTLIANAKKAAETRKAAKTQREMHRTMPDWWFKSATYPAEPNLSAARLVPMIKGYIAQWNLTYIKHMIVKTDGPLWGIKNNELGIPTYKDLLPYIYILYRDPKENNSCQLGALYMRRQYTGAGTYGEPFLGGVRDVEYIDCAVIK